jgi:hypothetical protein
MPTREHTYPGHTHSVAGQTRRLRALGQVAEVRLTADDTPGGHALFEVHSPPGSGVPELHTHPPSETFYVLEGRIRGLPRRPRRGAGDPSHGGRRRAHPRRRATRLQERRRAARTHAGALRAARADARPLRGAARRRAGAGPPPAGTRPARGGPAAAGLVAPGVPPPAQQENDERCLCDRSLSPARSRPPPRRR